MRKVKNLIKVVCITLLCFSIAKVSAQTIEPSTNYRFGGGLLIDVGDGSTLVGPHAKYFFTPNHAGEGAVLFGSGATYLQALYNYNMNFAEVPGLGWYVGAGPSVGFGNSTTAFYIIGALGLEYKVPSAPFAFSFDWRPRFVVVDSYTEFVAPRFGIGLRYTFN